MKKILIIGQAPPARLQKVPYDSTLLYIMLGWCGVSKAQAQQLFEFEAMSQHFPGFAGEDHAKPTEAACFSHFMFTLKDKIMEADCIWILGSFAMDMLPKLRSQIAFKDKLERIQFEAKWDCKFWIKTIHPSRRNLHRINTQKELLIHQITALLNHAKTI